MGIKVRGNVYGNFEAFTWVIHLIQVEKHISQLQLELAIWQVNEYVNFRSST